jgi:cyclophilin family peptidyl-prolyl cis-trans isomerase
MNESTQDNNLIDGIYAKMQTNKGEILLNLKFEDTPFTVANFISLAEGTNTFVSDEFVNKPYYNGIKFHRVIPDFMIQGGDPTGTGAGGPGYNFSDEFTKDESGALKHIHNKPGMLSMANAGPGTNGSQFFITHIATPWLDGNHTVFGEVISGQEVVDSIAQDDVIENMVIIRQGEKASQFNASSIFEDFLTKEHSAS